MISEKEYLDYIKKTCPKTAEMKTLFAAFIIGGIICMLGQAVNDVVKYIFPEMAKKDIGSITSMIMIFLGAFLTGIGIYDKIGSIAGAGSIIPITGFANSVVSPAIEFKSEGVIFGVMAKMFVIAGPIIVTAVVSSVGVGIIYYIIALFQ